MWFVAHALAPWTGPLREVEELEKDGPRFYKTNSTNTKLYNYTKQIFFAIKKSDFDTAGESIHAGRELDPSSPVFDYLTASVLWTKGDRQGTVKAIDAGNSMGMLRAYTSEMVSPEMWQWPEIDQAKNLGQEILDDPHCSRAEMITVLKLGNKLVWSAPPDFRRLLQSVQLRREAAEKLLPIARKEDNARLVKLCEGLIQESVQLKAAAKRKFAEDDQFLDGSRAWVVGRALDKHDPGFRYAAMLLMREKQAEWGRDFRNQYIKINTLRNL